MKIKGDWGGDRCWLCSRTVGIDVSLFFNFAVVLYSMYFRSAKYKHIHLTYNAL
jgi:hypothetical protein